MSKKDGTSKISNGKVVATQTSNIQKKIAPFAGKMIQFDDCAYVSNGLKLNHQLAIYLGHKKKNNPAGPLPGTNGAKERFFPEVLIITSLAI